MAAGCGTRSGCYVFDPNNPEFVRTDCGRYILCGGFDSRCACTEQECFSRPGAVIFYTATLDSLNPDILQLGSSLSSEIRYLERQP